MFEIQAQLGVGCHRSFRDWLPLSSEKGCTWFVHLQLQMKFTLMSIEMAGHTPGQSQSQSQGHTGAVNAVSTTQVRSSM